MSDSGLPPAVALDQGGMVLPAPGRRVALDGAPSDGSAWGALEAALGNAFGEPTGDRLAVALLAPWAEVRQLPLPPIDDAELAQLLARAGGRYFVGARGSQVVGVAPLARGVPRDAPRVAAAANARAIVAIESAARGAGWSDVAIVPAEAAWAAATARFWPSRAKAPVALLVTMPDRTTLVESLGGSLVGVRRFRAGARDAELVLAAVREHASVAVIGADPSRGDLVRALAPQGLGLQPVPEEWAELASDPAALAARCAPFCRAPLLASAAQRESRDASIRRRAWQFAGLAALLLLGAAGLELWGAHRELTAVQAERARVRPAVEATLVGRSSLEEAYRRLSEILAAEREAPRWSVLLADFAARVPEDAHLTGFRARGDSLVLDGLAVSAAQVFASLEESPALANLRASAPVRRQAPDGEEAMERFTIAALRRPARVEAP